MEFRRSIKEPDYDAAGPSVQGCAKLCLALADWKIAQGIPGRFTNARVLKHIGGKVRNHASEMKLNYYGGKLTRHPYLAVPVPAPLATHTGQSCVHEAT